MSEPTPYPTPSPRRPANRPVWAFAALAVFVASLTILYATGRDSGAAIYIALIAANLPTLVAAVASEQAARDIRNGTVAEKARQGAVDAIKSEGVLVRSGPVALASMQASQAQLEALHETITRLHALTAANAEKLDHTTAVVEQLVDDGGHSGS